MKTPLNCFRDYIVLNYFKFNTKKEVKLFIKLIKAELDHTVYYFNLMIALYLTQNVHKR